MLPYSITIPGSMRGKQRARVTRFGAYTPKETVAAENAIGFAARAAGVPVLAGPVVLSVQVVVEPPKSWPKKQRAAAIDGQRYPTVKPDLDNVVKLIGDALNGIAWNDDQQIVQVAAGKKYGPVAFAVVSWGPVAAWPREPVFTGVKK